LINLTSFMCLSNSMEILYSTCLLTIVGVVEVINN